MLRPARELRADGRRSTALLHLLSLFSPHTPLVCRPLVLSSPLEAASRMHERGKSHVHHGRMNQKKISNLADLTRALIKPAWSRLLVATSKILLAELLQRGENGGSRYVRPTLLRACDSQ